MTEHWTFVNVCYAACHGKIFSVHGQTMFFNSKTHEANELESFVYTCDVDDSDFDGHMREFWLNPKRVKVLATLKESVNCDSESDVLMLAYNRIQDLFEKYPNMTLASNCTVADFGMFDERLSLFYTHVKPIHFIKISENQYKYRHIEDTQLLMKTLTSKYGSVAQSMHSIYRVRYPAPENICLDTAYTFFAARWLLDSLLPDIKNIELCIK